MTKPPKFASHEEWARWKGCTSKRAYDTVVEANLDVLYLWKSGKDAHTYPCPFGCGKIHITTQAERGEDNGGHAEQQEGGRRAVDVPDQLGDRR